MSACRPLGPRASALLVALAGCLGLAACGGGQRQDAAEPRGNFPVAVTRATFPAIQTLAQRTHMRITVKNVGREAVPNLTVTVCNVSCAYPAAPGQGSSSAAFASSLNETDLANPSRPVWIVDRAPGACSGAKGYSCLSGGSGGDASAYTNTWAAGRLEPGASETFDWALSAVSTGRHTVAWVIGAGLNGKATAVLNGGGRPKGTFTVIITGRPTQSYVNNNGQIVTTRAP